MAYADPNKPRGFLPVVHRVGPVGTCSKCGADLPDCYDVGDNVCQIDNDEFATWRTGSRARCTSEYVNQRRSHYRGK